LGCESPISLPDRQALETISTFGIMSVGTDGET